jgi:hypothetical protein
MASEQRPRSVPCDTQSVVAVHRIRPEYPTEAILLSHVYGGCFVHFVKDTGRYCLGPKCRKEWHDKYDLAYRGYGAALVWSAADRVYLPRVLELSPSAEQWMHGRWARGGHWRLSVEDVKRGKRSPIFCELLGQFDAEVLPDSFNVLGVLCRMFNVPNVVLDVKNPMPPRVVAPIVRPLPRDSYRQIAEPVAKAERPAAIAARVVEQLLNGDEHSK